jgi:1D-myo-inositol-tetrakisphosphate 5-kinase/inositol-polyphosphate multikinase
LEVIRETIKKLESIKIWFEKQKTYHFYSSSLIVAYEANLNEINDVSSLVRVKLIDFAHVFPANDTCDENVLFGLKKLIEYLQKLLQSDYVFKDIRNKI